MTFGREVKMKTNEFAKDGWIKTALGWKKYGVKRTLKRIPSTKIVIGNVTYFDFGR